LNSLVNVLRDTPMTHSLHSLRIES